MKTWAALVALTLPLFAGGPLRTGFERLHVKDNRLVLRLARTVHLPGGETGVDPRESAASVHAAMIYAAREWTRAGKAAVAIDIEFTDNTKAELTGENVVTFTDTEPFDSGVCSKAGYIACTMLAYSRETGEIQAVSIAFNPYMRHSSIGMTGAHDIGAVMLHEVGHALGLEHSASMDSAMSAFVEIAGATQSTSFAQRRISTDDQWSLAEVYPLADQAQVMSRITGRVLVDGAPAGGVHVLAVDANGGAARSTLTAPDGSYSLLVEAGEYKLVAEPLDGPVRPVHFTQPPETAPAFRTVFWTAAGGALRGGEPVTVAAGEVRGGIEFQAQSGRAANIESIGLVDARGNYLGFGRVLVGRGQEYTIGVTRTPAEGNPALDFTQAKVVINGSPTVPSKAPQLVRQKIRIPEDVTPGAWSVYYRDDDSASLMAGSFIVVTSPSVTEIKPGEGRQLSITGTDLAAGEVIAERPSEDLPWPTQLGGIAVRIGDRFAPIQRVSPTEIVVEIPQGLTGDEAEVVVISGPVSQSKTLSIKL